jgi:UDP:flavonoid glycosyltransferase YjiC (YdhE family)
MGYYGFVSPAYTGHLNPTAVLGRELQRRGHRVAILAPPDARAKVEREGLEYLPIAADEFPPGAWEQAAAEIGVLSGLKASRFVGRWLGRLARGIFRDLPGVAAREKFDGLVMDQICVGVESVCAAHRLPLVVAVCALTLHAEPAIPPLVFAWRYCPSLPFRLRNAIGLLAAYSTGWPVTIQLLRYRRQNRLPQPKFYHMNEMPPSLAQVAQQPAIFDFPRGRLPNHFHYTAPWVDREKAPGGDFPWDRLDGRPLIYASLGTLQNRMSGAFQTIAEACSGLDAQLVLALGRTGGPAPRNLAGAPIVVGYAPQKALLRRANLVVTHGGLNTTLEALSEGLPMVVTPITNDQPGVAARVAHLGLGEFIPVRQLKAPALRTAILRVLQTPRYRERARQFANDLGRLNGPALAADIIETAFTTRQRVARLSPKSSWTGY